MQEKLEAFRALLESDKMRGHLEAGYRPDIGRHDARIKMGRKYANIDHGESGYYMLELETGRIFGIKGYGVIHRGHQYGTLDTINDWDWSGHRAVKKQTK